MFCIEPLDEVLLIYIVFFIFLLLLLLTPQLWFCSFVPVFTTPAVLHRINMFQFLGMFATSRKVT